MKLSTVITRGAAVATILLCALFLTVTGAVQAAPAPTPTKLSAAGKALLPVVVSEQASDKVKATAQSLADYLQKISGAAFEVKTGDGTKGLAVGVFTDFPAVKSGAAVDAQDPRKREDYLLRSHAAGIYLLGTTELAAQHAVWDLLYRLGYRQFFPGPTWEVIPNTPNLAIAVDAWESPDYHSRRIWYQYGSYPYNVQQYNDWCAKNRMLGGIALHTGHAYGNIIRRCQAEFDAHPEYFSLVNGERRVSPQGKFCISNPGLRQVVVNYCLKQFTENPALDSTSLDPSDGGGWCECAACKEIGSVSNRVLTLANEAAEAVNKQFPGKYIGIYAYNQHSPPPTIRVHPNVIVSVATAFISGGFSVDQLLEGWSAQGGTLGIREYYSVNVWNRDLPGNARGTNLDYLQRTIPHFFDKGGRFMSSESTDSWGPCGRGYYFAARLLWDVKEAGKREAIMADFFEKCFGPAKKPVMDFYARIEGGKPIMMSDDLIGRMYRDLKAAKALTKDPKVIARIHELILYTKYVDLFQAYSAAGGDERQQAFEKLIRFAYAISSTGMISTIPLWRDLPNRDKSVKVPPEAHWQKPETSNPWKQNPPLTPEVIDAILENGIAANKLMDFTPIAFSDELAPATKLNLPKAPDAGGILARFGLRVYTWVPAEKKEIGINFVGNGRIFTLDSPKNAAETPLVEQDLRKATPGTADAPMQVKLTTEFDGLHTVLISGSKDGYYSVSVQDGLHMTVPAADALATRWGLYFYVPKGTKIVGGYASATTGDLRDAEGKKIFDFTKMEAPGYFSVAVPPGHDGKLWRTSMCTGTRILMTVPPYYARNAEELLLPREVVEKDAPK